MALPPRKHRRKLFPEPAKERAVPEAVPEPELLPRQAPVKFRHEREKDEQAQKDQEFLDNWRGEETAIVPTPILLRFQVFVGHYLCCLNAAEAARRTGFYKHPARSGADLLRHPEVQKLLYEQQRSLLAKIGVTAERIWAEYARIAFLDPAEAFEENGEFKPIPDIPEEIRRAITSYKVKRMSFGEDGESVERELKFAGKQAALDKLAQLAGLTKSDELNKQDLAEAIMRGLMDARQRALEAQGDSEAA